MLVDQESRIALINIINQYLDEEITAFEFDDAIFDLETEDKTVRNIASLLWYHYDDCTDHKVDLSKAQWDYFQRLVLILASDSHVERISHRKWSLSQIVAAIAIVLFVTSACTFGFGVQLFAVAAPFGLVSIGISEWRRRNSKPLSPMEIALTPFSSLREVRNARKQVQQFNKKRWPEHLRTSQLDRVATNTVRLLAVYLPWLLCSPLVLLWQMIPAADEKYKVVSC